MKRFLALLLTALLGAGLAACAAETGGDAGDARQPDGVVLNTAVPAQTAPVTQIIPETPPEPEPEPDYVLFIADEPIPTVVGCCVTDRITAHVINNTGETAEVLLIPYLEKLDENGDWVQVPFKDGVGFCGTPDPLPAGGTECSWEISAIWGALEDGRYRMNYKVGPASGMDRTVSGEFTLFTPENNAGLPLAPRD